MNVDEETKHNCWSISLDDDLAKVCTVENLADFLKEVKTDRKKQLRNSNLKVGLIYYLWIDKQVGQLRFNFINSNHKNLPFKAQVTLVQTEDEVISEYMKLQFENFSSIQVYTERIDR